MDVGDFPTWPLPGATKASTPADQQSQRVRRGRCACGLAWWALTGWTNRKNVKKPLSNWKAIDVFSPPAR